MFTGNLVIKVRETKSNRDFFPTSPFQNTSLGVKLHRVVSVSIGIRCKIPWMDILEFPQ